MAVNQIPIRYNLRQNSNENNKSYGKWFPQPECQSTLSLRGLADHIAEHGTVYTQDVVYGVLKKFTSCLIELVTRGTPVKLDGLGKFYPTFESTGAQSAVGYNIAEHLEGVHMRFRPEGVQLDNITSRALVEKCKFEQNMIFDMYGVPKKVVNGELVNYGEGDEEEPEGDGD